jgi:hypothetical protein
VNTVTNVTASLKGREFLYPLSDCQALAARSLLRVTNEVSFDVPHVTTPNVSSWQPRGAVVS